MKKIILFLCIFSSLVCTAQTTISLTDSTVNRANWCNDGNNIQLLSLSDNWLMDAVISSKGLLMFKDSNNIICQYIGQNIPVDLILIGKNYNIVCDTIKYLTINTKIKSCSFTAIGIDSDSNYYNIYFKSKWFDSVPCYNEEIKLFTIYAYDKHIYLENVDNELIYIYNIQGNLLHKELCKSNHFQVCVTTPGIYVIYIGKNVYKEIIL